jgi:uncharacterized protein (DUF2147 family)
MLDVVSKATRMRGKLAWALQLVVSLSLALPGVARSQALTPVGRWRTFDDHTGRERGLVEIHDEAGVLTGTIVGTVDPQDASRRCELCSGDRHEKPILGLTIITGMRQDGNAWRGGEILDPETGSVYRCTMRLTDGGQKLVLRGYVGVSLFGRSQTWLRAP